MYTTNYYVLSSIFRITFSPRWIWIYMLFTGFEVRIGEYCAQSIYQRKLREIYQIQQKNYLRLRLVKLRFHTVIAIVVTIRFRVTFYKNLVNTSLFLSNCFLKHSLANLFCFAYEAVRIAGYRTAG